MYAPYAVNPHHSQDYGYYTQEPYQNQGPPAMNPFIANPGPKRKRNRKQKEMPRPAVPQPGTAAAAASAAAAATAAVTAVTAVPTAVSVPVKPTAPTKDPHMEWILVPKGTAPPNPATPASVEPEVEKVSELLAEAQKEVDRAQWLVESALTILVEARQEYPMAEVGILEAFMPAKRIEVVTAVTTLTSIFLSGYYFFQKLGLPDKRENRVLSRARTTTHSYAHFAEKGVLTDFADLSHLTPAEQNQRLRDYEWNIQGPIRAFLTQFMGHQTMHRTPAIMLRMGAPTTILHEFMSQRSYVPPHFMKDCKEHFTIHGAFHAVQDDDPLGLAEVVRLNLKELSGPLEHRTTVLKALGVHMRDLIAATVYLETAGSTITWPSLDDLNNWAGLSNYNPALMDDLQIGVSDLQYTTNQNQAELEKLMVLMRAVVKKMHLGVTVDSIHFDHQAVPPPSPPNPTDQEDDVISE